MLVHCAHTVHVWRHAGQHLGDRKAACIGCDVMHVVLHTRPSKGLESQHVFCTHLHACPYNHTSHTYTLTLRALIMRFHTCTCPSMHMRLNLHTRVFARTCTHANSRSHMYFCNPSFFAAEYASSLCQTCSRMLPCSNGSTLNTRCAAANLQAC